MKTILHLRKFGFILFMSASLSPGVFAQEVPEIKKASYMLDIEQPKKAIELLKQAIASNAVAAPALYYYLGHAQLVSGNKTDAAGSFNKGIELNEKEALNYVGKGYLELLNKKPADAKVLFDKALGLTKSKNVAVLQAIGEAYESDSKTAKDAQALLEKARGIEETNADTHLLLGDAYLLENNGGSAVSSYERAAKHDPKSAKPFFKIGEVYQRSQNNKVAEEEYLKGSAIDPQYAPIHRELGELYYNLKDGQKAVKEYEAYMAITEKPEDSKLRYAFFLVMAKDFTKANTIFKELVERPNVTPITWRYYARSAFEAGDAELSQKVFDKYFAVVPADQIEASDYTYQGKMLQKSGKDSLATISFEKSLELDKNQMELRQNLADTYFKLKKYPEAIRTYKKMMAMRSNPLSQEYYNIGRAYYATKQYDAADSSFQKLIEMQPNMTVGYLWEARTKSNLDPESEVGLAKPFYEKLIEKANPEKNKKDLEEAYGYLGYYYILKNDIPAAKSSLEKVLLYNPNNEKAITGLKEINKVK